MRPIHERVKDHVQRSRLTYSKIADRTGFSEQRVYRLLNKKTAFSAEDMEAFASAIGVSVGELFHDPRSARRRTAA